MMPWSFDIFMRKFKRIRNLYLRSLGYIQVYISWTWELLESFNLILYALSVQWYCLVQDSVTYLLCLIVCFFLFFCLPLCLIKTTLLSYISFLVSCHPCHLVIQLTFHCYLLMQTGYTWHCFKWVFDVIFQPL